MQRRLLDGAEEGDSMEVVELKTPPPSPVNTGLFQRTPSLQRRSLELRDTNKTDNCHYPVKQYLNNDITFSQLIQTLDIIPVDYIQFDEIAADYLESLQQRITSDYAMNDQIKAEYDAFIEILNSDAHPQGLKTVLLNAFCKRWDLLNNAEDKNYRPRM